MCWCTPHLRTIFCGKAGCVAPSRAAHQLAVSAGLNAGPVPDAPPVPDALERIGQAVGLKPGEAQKLAADVKANHALLEACPRHRFDTPLDPPGSRLRIRWRCSVCTGTVDGSTKHWYERGLAHAAA